MALGPPVVAAFEDVGRDVIDQSDDVLYPVKLDVDETALVEAQACAVAVAERQAP